MARAYRCAGPGDDWIAVTVRDDQQWCALVDLMDRPSWCDEGMASAAGRRERADEIDRRLQDWFAGQSLESAVERLAGAGIPAAPVVSPSLVTENPQLRDRCGLTDEELARLASNGVIGTRPKGA